MLSLKSVSLILQNSRDYLSMIKTWLLAARPKTLTAAILPVLTATALTNIEGHTIKWWVTGFCLLGALLIQIATNFINDAIDFDKGADTVQRIGPRRATQSGLVSRNHMMWLAGATLLAAFLIGIPLALEGGWPIVFIGLVSIFLAYSYTGGPFPLAYIGLGDFFVILFFGLIAVGGVYYLQTASYTMSAFVLGLQMGFLSTVLIAINNLRDVFQDRDASKKTLAVRFGVRFARFEIIFLVLSAFMLQLYWHSLGYVWATLLPFVFLPWAGLICVNVVKTDPSSAYNRFLAQSALLHGGFGLILSVGLYLS